MNSNWQKNNYILRMRDLPVFVLYTIVTMVVYLLPYTKFTMPYICVACLMLISLPFIMLRRSSWFTKAGILLVLSFFVCLMNLVGGNYSFIDALNEMLRNIRFFIPVFWASYSIYYLSNRQRKKIMFCFMIVVTYIMFQTIKALSENRWITRLLAEDKSMSSAEVNVYRLQNVGGFEYSYMMGIVVLCLVWTVLNVKSIWVKVISLSLSLIGFYYIIRTMYTTLLLLTVMGIALLIFFSIKNPFIKLVFIITSITILLLIVPLLGYLSGAFGDSLLAEKFTQIQQTLIGEGIDELGVRPKLMANALKNWIKSPIWGGYGIDSNAHSFIFTMLEQNGLIGLGCWGILYWQSWKMVTGDLKRQNVRVDLFHIVMLYVLVLCFLNPIGYAFEITIMAFYVTSLWLTTCCSENKKRRNFNEKVET